MSDNTLILWLAIWGISLFATMATKDGGIMLIPAVGMLIWYFHR